MSTPVISIVVPCYKVREYVAGCVRSLFRQTLQEPFEIILVDDADPEGSVEEVRKIEPEKPAHVSLLYLRHERNGGLSAARNTGTDAARGQYVLYVDSDDELYPEALARLLGAARQSGAVVTSGLLRTVTPDNVQRTRPSAEGFFDNAAALGAFLRYETDGVACSKLVRLDFLRDKHIRFLEGVLHEDEVWNTDMLLAGATFCGTPHVTYMYKIEREGSIMGQDNLRQYRACIEVCNHNADSFESTAFKDMPELHLRLASYSLWYLQPSLADVARAKGRQRFSLCHRLAKETMAVSPLQRRHWRRAGMRRARLLACILSLPAPRFIRRALLAISFHLASLRIHA